MKALNLSRKALKPSIWGQYIWRYLFVTCYYFECFAPCQDDINNKLNQLLHENSIVLFCAYCRMTFIDYISIHPPLEFVYQNWRKQSKQTSSLLPLFMSWLYKLKSFVNQKLDKKNLSINQVIPHYIEQSKELMCWEIKNEPSSHYQDSFWIFLYCLAFNFPPNTQEPELDVDEYTFDEKINIALHTRKIIVLITDTLLIGQERKWNWARNIRYHQPIPLALFQTRQEAVQYIYNWESKTTHQGTFGKTQEQVIDYFESNFRSS